MTSRPPVAGNWAYSIHAYNYTYGTFSDGVARHDDFGITLVNAALANATAWKVPLYMGESATSLRTSCRTGSRPRSSPLKTWWRPPSS